MSENITIKRKDFEQIVNKLAEALKIVQEINQE